MVNQAAASIPPGPCKLTLADYLLLPDDGRRHELLDGDDHVTPAPIPRHQKIMFRIDMFLCQALEERGQGVVYTAPIDVVLGPHDIVQPDILFIRRERMHIVGPLRIEGAPDLIIEVLSPATRRQDILYKSHRYAQAGVRHYWIVDPDIDRVECFRLQDGGYQATAIVSSPATAQPPDFEGLALPLDRIFA